MKKIKCPLCDDNFISIDGLQEHVEEDHIDEIPEDYSPMRYLYYLRTGKTHGSCIVCHKDTEWNETTNKYHRFCKNPKCKEKYVETFQKRMIGKYGKTTLLNDPNQQRKMLANRKISGEYKWSDGSIKTYTGTYELDFLKFLDLLLQYDSDDIMTPSPHTYYYIYENEKKFYIPDMYIASLNLEIEIKDGGNNENKHPKIQAVDKVKEKLKDDVMKSIKDVDYLKITNKEYDIFIQYLNRRKEEYIRSNNIDIRDIVKESSLLNKGLDLKYPVNENTEVSTFSEGFNILKDIINE